MLGRIAAFATKAMPVVGQVVMVATIIVEVAAVIQKAKKIKGRA